MYMDNYAKLLKRLLPSLITIIVFSGQVSLAQDYTPPPMFGQSEELEDISPALKETVKPRTEELTLKAYPIADVPKPGVKPKKIEEATPSIVKAIVPMPSKKPKLTEKSSTQRPGIVKGPKTMPAVPAKGFESKVLFENEKGEIEGAILKRHIDNTKKTEESDVEEKIIPSDEVDSRLDIYELAGGKAKKITIPYAPGFSDIKTDISTALENEAQVILSAHPDWRVQIQAFATPFDQGQSSDRRMSLNRALSIRDILLKQGLEPRRIDVRALGMQTEDKTKDRVDIIFLSPGTSL